MNICIKNYKNIRIRNYTNIRHTLPEYDFDVNEYQNIFVSRKGYKLISGCICIKQNKSNEYSNKYL